MSDYHNQLAIDSMRPGEPQQESLSDLSGLTEEDQAKLADYDLLHMDARFTARRLCLFLQRYRGQMPAEAAAWIEKILNDLLMQHLNSKDLAWLDELVRKVEAA